MKYQWLGVIPALIFVGACGGSDDTPNAATAATVTKTVTEKVPETITITKTAKPPKPPKPAGYTPKKTDISLTVKIKSKQCFGTAGCNIGYSVGVTWSGPRPVDLDADYDVTYQVNGDESGPIIETLVLHKDGSYDIPFGSFASTTSSSVELTAHVQSLSENYGGF